MDVPPRRADFVCKLVLIGDSGVGKTCVMRRFTDDEFSYNFVATIGIDFKIRMLEINGLMVKVQIWDTAGQEKYRSITTAYYRGAKAVLIVYDITNRKSFEHVTNWITNMKRWADNDIERMLIGNKCDKEDERSVETKEGERLAKDQQMFFSETSAKESKNVDTSFMMVLDKIVEKYKKQRENEDVEKKSTVSLERTRTSSSDKEKRCC